MLSGPPLRSVLERGPWAKDDSSFFRWVRDPGAFVKKDRYARNLFRQYGQLMPAFPHLQDDELQAIRAFLQSANAKP